MSVIVPGASAEAVPVVVDPRGNVINRVEIALIGRVAGGEPADGAAVLDGERVVARLVRGEEGWLVAPLEAAPADLESATAALREEVDLERLAVAAEALQAMIAQPAEALDPAAFAASLEGLISAAGPGLASLMANGALDGLLPTDTGFIALNTGTRTQGRIAKKVAEETARRVAEEGRRRAVKQGVREGVKRGVSGGVRGAASGELAAGGAVIGLAVLLYLGLAKALLAALSASTVAGLVSAIKVALTGLLNELRKKMADIFAKLAIEVAAALRPDVRRALDDYIDALRRAAEEVLDELEKLPRASLSARRDEIFNRLLKRRKEALEQLRTALLRVRADPDQVEALLKELEYLVRFGDYMEMLNKLLGGGLTEPDLAFTPEERNILRRHPKVFGGNHRRGGFGYGEFDDEEENPDISGEDPAAPVDAGELLIDPELDTRRFTCDQLLLRVQNLATLLRRTLKEAVATSDKVRQLQADGEGEAANRQLVILDARERELARLLRAVENAVADMLYRPCPVEAVARALALLGELRTQREAQLAVSALNEEERRRALNGLPAKR